MSSAPPRPLPLDADQLVRDLYAQRSETQVDYKTAIPLPTDGRARAKLAKQVMGFANHRDGGYLLIGVDDKTQVAVGLTQEQAATWDPARLASSLAPYCGPPPSCQVFRGSLEDGTTLVAVRIAVFLEQPIVCTQSVHDDAGAYVIRAGAIYIRTGGTETKEITTEAEMRELLDRAYVKKADQLLQKIKTLIDAHWPGNAAQTPNDLLARIEEDLDAVKFP